MYWPGSKKYIYTRDLQSTSLQQLSNHYITILAGNVYLSVAACYILLEEIHFFSMILKDFDLDNSFQLINFHFISKRFI